MRFARSLTSLFLTLALAAAACGDDSTADAESSAATRQVLHAMGKTDVPVEAERVVVLDSSFLDDIERLLLP